ncbi:MAG: TonB family protein [Saprospiraceae bacterium]|nr:TonB family protein [Saprospiraceae bacterium]
MKAVIHQEEDRTKAILTTLLFHAGLLAILFFYRFHASEPITEAPAIVLDWGGGGDNAAAGLPDEGQGNDPAPQGQQMDDPSSTEPADEPASSATPSTPPPSKTPPASDNNKVEVPKNTPTSNDAEAASVRKAQDEAKKKQQAEQDRIRKQEADRLAEQDRQRKAAEDAAKQAQAERDKKKGAFGSTFGKPGANGPGQGNTDKPGNQGVPNGNGNNPSGKSPGSGGGEGGGDGTGIGESIGGGLLGRKIQGRPSMVDNTQKTGKVTVRVTVNADGKVTNATWTQAGSTTTDSELRNKAEAWARQYRFAPSSAAEQTGTITFDFTVK